MIACLCRPYLVYQHLGPEQQLLHDLIYQSKLISNVLEAAQILPSISFNTAIDTVIETTKQTIKYKQSPTQKAQQPKAVSYRANVIKTRTCLEVHK